MRRKAAARPVRVQVAGRLVGEDHLGPGDQRPGQGDPLLLAAGQLARPVTEAVGEPSDSMRGSNSAGSGLRPASSIGSVMFCAAVSCGSRLNDWKTKPIRSRRTLVSTWSDCAVRSVPPSSACPLVAVSRPARQCIRVDLPEPDGPMIAVNWARPKPTVTPSSARTAVSPWP